MIREDSKVKVVFSLIEVSSRDHLIQPLPTTLGEQYTVLHRSGKKLQLCCNGRTGFEFYPVALFNQDPVILYKRKPDVTTTLVNIFKY